MREELSAETSAGLTIRIIVCIFIVRTTLKFANIYNALQVVQGLLL